MKTIPGRILPNFTARWRAPGWHREYSKMDLETIIIFSSWPNMPVNKNDSEIQMFTKYFNIIDKSVVLKQMQDIRNVEDTGKNKNVANTLRADGNKFYTNLNYSEALKLYNRSISRAPPNSEEFGLAIANRSAVLFGLEKYEECLQDTNKALKSEFPIDLRYKLFLRQSKCYLKLNNNFEAAKSLRKAEECLGKLNMSQQQIVTINDAIKELKNKLKEQIEATAPENESDDLVLTEPTLKDGENPKFVDAAKVVDYKYTKQLGRHMVANTEIKKGDVLFIEKPYSITTIHVQKVHLNICAFCFKSALNCIPCTVCSSYVYCSDSCRQGAWDLGHRWKCLGASQGIITHVSCALSLSTLFQASRDGFKTTIEDETVYGNKVNNYPFVNKLVTHKNRTSNDKLQIGIKAAVWMVMYLKNFTDYFDWLFVQPNRPECSLEELYNFIGGQLVKYLLQSSCNFVVVREVMVNFNPIKLVKLIYEGTGFGIYVSTALLNHSCLPNAVRSFDGSTCIVRAVGDIKKGTEVTINYLEDSYFVSETIERQLKLERYMFTCSCPPCADSSYKKSLRPLVCPRCSGKAFPLGNNLKAKCTDCFMSFSVEEYFKNSKKIEEYLSMFEMVGDEDLLDASYKLLKKTFHRYSEYYIKFYGFCLKHYEKTDQVKKCMDIAKSTLEPFKNVYGETNTEYICTFLSYTYLLAKYSIILRNQSKDDKKFVDEAKALIKKSVDILPYYVSNRNIKEFIANITKYLNSDNVNTVIDDLIFENKEESNIILPF